MLFDRQQSTTGGKRRPGEGGWIDAPFTDRDASYPRTVAGRLHAAPVVIGPDAHAYPSACEPESP